MTAAVAEPVLDAGRDADPHTDLEAGRDADLDADLGDRIAAGRLGPPPTDLAQFEQRFVASVVAGAADPDTAWDRFYDATLARVLRGWGRDTPGDGTVATFTRIWSRAAALSRGGDVLDVGTCFGFFPLAWSAQAGAPRLLAVELSAAGARLAGRQARRLERDVAVLCADGARLPLPGASVGTVHLLHVLEHLPAALGQAVLAEARRVARERVVVAVPVEPRPDPVFGHVRVFDVPLLAELGRRTGWNATASSADGAWLVLDRP
jgi:SAM-dependent methyltransferase